MNNIEILNLYTLLKDQGVHEEDIVQGFMEREGIDIEAMRTNKTLMPQSEMVPYQKQKAQQDNLDQYQKGMESAGEAAWDVIRQIGQGASFGTADELEAYTRSKMPDSFGFGTYDEEIKNVNTEMEDYIKENPGSAAMAEIAGALMVPGMVIGRVGKYLPYVGKIKEGQWFQNFIKRMTIGAGAGAVDMGLYGYGTGKGGFGSDDRKNRALNSALVGAAVGGPLGVAGGFVEHAATAISNKMGKKGMEAVDVDGNILHTGAPAKDDRAALQLMNDQMAKSFEGFDDLRKVMDDVIKLDPNIAATQQIADLTRPGSNLRALHQKLGQTPSRGGSALEVLERRAEGFKKIAQKGIKRFLGKNIDDPVNWLKLWSDRTSQLVGPIYREADPKMVRDSGLWNEINRLLKRKDDVGDMVRKAYNATRREIPGLNEITELTGNLPSRGLVGEVPINHLHALKRFIGQEIKKMPKPEGKNTKPYADIDAGNLINIEGKISSFLKDSHPSYKRAARIFSSRMDFEKAFETGVKASEAGGKHTSAMVRRELSEMLPSSQNAYRLGYASKMYKRVRSNNTRMADASKIQKLFEEEERDKLLMLYKSPMLAEEFFKKMDTLSRMDFRAKELILGSKTDKMREVGKMLDGEPGIATKLQNTFTRSGQGAKILDNMDQTRMQNRQTAINPYINAQGPPRIQETMQRMQAERIRSMNQEQSRALYPGMFPAILGPNEELKNQNPRGLLE